MYRNVLVEVYSVGRSCSTAPRHSETVLILNIVQWFMIRGMLYVLGNFTSRYTIRRFSVLSTIAQVLRKMNLKILAS